MVALRFPTLTSHVCIQHRRAYARNLKKKKMASDTLYVQLVVAFERKLSVDERVHACVRVRRVTEVE